MKRRLPLLLMVLGLGSLGIPAQAFGFDFQPSPHEMNVHSERREAFVGGSLAGTPAGNFEDACGVALAPQSSLFFEGQFLYIADYYHDKIDALASHHGYTVPLEGEITIHEVAPGNGPCGLAVDSWGDVFVNSWHEDVLMFTPSGLPGTNSPNSHTEYTRTTLDGESTDTGVAVVGQKACGFCEEEQLVYVDTRTAINEYEITENSQIPRVTTFVQTIGSNPSAEYYGVGVSTFPATNGFIYVADASTDTVKVFNPAVSTTAPVEEIDGAGTPQHGFDYLGESTVTVDDNPESPSYGHIYLMDNLQRNVTEHPEVAVDEFNSHGSYRGQISHWIAPEGEPPVPTEHWLTASDPNGLVIGQEGNVIVSSGNDEGSAERDKNNVGSVLYMFEPMKLAKPLSVKMSGSGHGAVVSAPAGINCGTACEAEYTKEAGEIVKLTATEDAHSEFVGWTGGCSGTEPICHVTVENEAIEVTAEFRALPQQSLTATVTGSGEGTVTSEPAGIECAVGSTCEEEFNAGSTITLIAKPAPHNKVAHWSGCSFEPSPTECSVQMSAAESVEAEFSPIPQKTLSVGVSGPGTVQSEPSGISCPSDCAEEVDEEGILTLIASPAPHQELASWSGCSVQPAPNECTVAMNGQDRSVSAEFTPIRHRLAVAIVGGGSVSADHGGIVDCSGTGGSCSTFYLDGEIARLTATPALGYQFVGWSGGVCGGSGTCEVRLEADSLVTASFAPLPSQQLAKPLIERIALLRASISGTSATLTVNVSGAGVLSASGKGLSPAHTDVKEAGTAVLHLQLTRAARRVLERSGRHRLNVSVLITFAPASGANHVMTTHLLTFRAGRRHRGKHQ
jgi:hypothetical protein